jgi:hypothetical protein
MAERFFIEDPRRTGDRKLDQTYDNIRDNNEDDIKIKANPLQSLSNFISTGADNRLFNQAFDIGRQLGLGYDQIKTLIRFFLLPEKQTGEWDEERRTSKLGTKIDKYTLIEWVSDDGEEFELFMEIAFVTLENKNEWVKTHIPGMKGSFKEWLYNDDTQISISGLLFGQPKQTWRNTGGDFSYQQTDYNILPIDDIEILRNLKEYIGPVSITNTTLNQMDVYEIIVTDLTIGESETYKNAVTFTLSAISDDSEFDDSVIAPTQDKITYFGNQ